MCFRRFVLNEDAADLRPVSMGQQDLVTVQRDLSDILCGLLDNTQLVLRRRLRSLCLQRISTQSDDDLFHPRSPPNF